MSPLSSVFPSNEPEAFRKTSASSFTTISFGRVALSLLFSSAQANKLGEKVNCHRSDVPIRVISVLLSAVPQFPVTCCQEPAPPASVTKPTCAYTFCP